MSFTVSVLELAFIYTKQCATEKQTSTGYTEKDDSCGNVYGLYSGVARFEFRPGYRLS
jgi:hypothetical protein